MSDTKLARNVDLLLRAYPVGARADDLRADLLASALAGRSWPELREVRFVVVEGLRARARGNTTNAVQSWARFVADSLAWAIGLSLGAVVRLGLRWSMPHVLLAMIIALYGLAAVRAKVFALATLVAAFVMGVWSFWISTGPAIVAMNRNWRHEETWVRLVIGALLIFGLILIVAAARGRRGALFPLGVLVAAGMVGMNTLGRGPSWPTRHPTALMFAGYSVALMFEVSALAGAAAFAHKQRARPTLRWSLLAAPFLGAMVATPGVGGAAYAVAAVVALLAARANPRPVVVLCLVPWGMVAGSAVPMRLIYPTPGNGTVLDFSVLGGVLGAAVIVIVLSVRRLHRTA